MVNKDQNDKKEEKDWKEKLILPGIILIIVAFIIYYNLFAEDGEEGNDTSTGTTSITQTDDPDGARVNDEYDDSGSSGDESGSGSGSDNNERNEDVEVRGNDIPQKQNTTSPSPTTMPEAPAIGDGSLDSNMNLADPKQADMETSAKLAAGKMFTISNVGPESSWVDSFNKMLETHGTERMKKEGMRKWWKGTDHSTGWYSLYGKDSTITAIPKLKGTTWWADDMVRVTYNVGQIVRNEAVGTLRSKSFDLELYMKYVDGGWYVDQYNFPNDPPSLY